MSVKYNNNLCLNKPKKWRIFSFSTSFFVRHEQRIYWSIFKLSCRMRGASRRVVKTLDKEIFLQKSLSLFKSTYFSLPFTPSCQVGQGRHLHRMTWRHTHRRCKTSSTSTKLNTYFLETLFVKKGQWHNLGLSSVWLENWDYFWSTEIWIVPVCEYLTP